MYLIDPKTGKKSVTLTVFILGVTVALLKLLGSGIVITIADKSLNLGSFSGVECAAVITAVGAIYWGRKNTDSKKEKNNE
jgi:hypothetical protein